MLNHVPGIRFAGFSEGWKHFTLDKIAEVNPKSILPEVFEYIDLESVVGTKLISHRTENKENAPSRAQRLAVKGDIFFQMVRPYQKNNYLYDLPYDNYVFSTGYAQIRSNIDNAFLFSVLQDDRFVSKVLIRCTGTSYPAINSKDLARISLKAPNSNEEQQKIGSLFKQLDDTIALQQQLVKQQQEYKKAMLQKMFPQKDEQVPKLRFSGFSGEWRETTIGQLSHIRRGASPRPIQDSKWFDSKSDIGWLRIADVTEQGGRIHHLEQRISKLGQEKTLVLTKTHLILSIAATVGKPVLNYIKTGVHDGFIVFVNPKFDLEYMFQWLEMFKPNWKKYGQPGSQVNLNSELVKQQSILIPNFEEQKKIGEFFKQLDDVIALNEKKLKDYQQLKKALLQRMFV